LKTGTRILIMILGAVCLSAAFLFSLSSAQNSTFHNAPDSTSATKNPAAGRADANEGGAILYAANCASCHGNAGKGTGNIPALADGPAKTAKEGELFWFITNGDLSNGMPAWGQLSDWQRWQLVTFLKSGSWGMIPIADESAAEKPIVAPPPVAPFTDFRFEKPGETRKITVKDLPAPFATTSSSSLAQMVLRPKNMWPQAPAGFKVDLYATGLGTPRLIRTAPNGDYFVAESDGSDIKIFRGITSDSKPKQVEVFATGLNRPYGIAFYPPGPNPQWVYVGDTDAVLRFPYHNGDLKATGPAEHIMDLPQGGAHWTRSVEFSTDGKRMFVSVGTAANVEDIDTHPAEKNRGDILSLNPDGSDLKIYASGIRNPGGGLAVDPKTGIVWCSVNERDALGDNLVPDYLTHVEDGGFYGWPWYYMGGNQDPRLPGMHPELKDKVLTPDVMLQPHIAALQFAFYDAKQFPKQYDGDIFLAEHGSWNKSVRAGYEVVRVPRHQTRKASGEHEDFLTGFVLPDGKVWGRPVGVTIATDGSLLITDDGSNSIWRVSYKGH
jgi:glucose/arabinose dehydrogenase/mono/diheme cytochrome c family protein